ncbi:MAG: hybrid sensor histidine kinase/response regulator [Arcobacteraceae bacterium]|nr:hybrid sensor histidine kinase/response regulator [Arcobacteraceae bacterium]
MEPKQTILIVDDTKANVDILLNLLEDYELVVALDGYSALDILNEDNEIDLILLDVMMPEIDGFEVCRRIQKNPKIAHIPVIFITARTEDESIEKGFSVGGVDYVQKPFRAIELLSRIKTQLKIKANEKKLIEFNKFEAISELLENMAHQWRQPLSAISVSASGMMLQKEMEMLTDESFYSLSNAIVQNTQSLSKTLSNFGKVFQYKAESDSFLLDKFLEDEKEELFKKNENIEFIFQIKKGLFIKGSSDKFSVILENIIQNSIDALVEHQVKDGLIAISAYQKNENIIVNIKDNGGGINKEIIEKIFEPYFTTQHKSLGKGLGLYVVYFLVKESFQGDIRVYNDEIEYKNKKTKGVTFEIILPSN